MLAGCLLAPAVQSASAQSAAPPPLAPFVLPWDDAGDGGVSDAGRLLRAPAGADGFISATPDGRLAAAGRRVRLFGVNLCFGACFPTHDQADAIAPRLARLGVNAVRFHHMDTSVAPNGLLRPDKQTLDADMLDRLDYLVAALKKHGLYTNLNLHVGRSYPGLPGWAGQPSFFKGVDNFAAEMVRQQRQYARDLLGHRNPYTKTRYADEPAVAIVEINNENGLIQEWLGGGLDGMPAVYGDELAGKWNAHLAARYADDAALRRAWGVADSPLGAELLANGDFHEQPNRNWALEQHGGARATLTMLPAGGPGDGPAARVTVQAAGQASWHVQFNQGRLALGGDQACTLSFQARADRPRSVTANLGQAHEPWAVVWQTRLDLTADWQRFRFTMAPGVADANYRVCFTGLNAAGARFEWAAVSLRPGGLVGLKEGERLGRIEWFRHRDLGQRPPAAQRDWLAFLWQLERNYWQGMRRFVADELGYKGVVVGTIVGCSTPLLMAGLDACDTHAYWQHPRFPGRPWDPANWHVTNVSMVNAAGGTLGRLAGGRVFGKPHLVTEYNHAAPNTYSSEAPLLLAAYAALQDWDGIFLFAYCHRRDDWDARKIPNFFDVDQHPTKLVNLPVAANIFLRGDVAAAKRLLSPRLAGVAQEVELLRTRGRPWSLVDARLLGAPPEAALVHRMAMRLGSIAAEPATESLVADFTPPADRRFVSDTGQLAWDLSRPGQGVVTVDSPRTKAVVGFVAGRRFALGGVTIAPGRTRQDWCTIALSLVEGESLAAGPARALLVATGYAENTAMGWKDAARTTVGRDWGRAPSLVEPIDATIELPAPAGRVSVWALDERGRRAGALAVEDRAGRAAVRIGADSKFKTLWYEIEFR